ncbi:MAG TPA: phage terminase small subunit P27 family [Acetobacteraceae bacterium]|nr:phage terminase small subunit P27 family [Acetobacteraceae bacterium]
MRGAKPKATVVKLITGNPGRRPLNKAEAKPRVEIPRPPETLKGAALSEWKRVVPLLMEVGLITKLDRAVVAGYCQAWARWIECERMLEQTGLVVKAPSGYPMYSPYLAAANKALDQMRQLSEQIGLSGSARSRIRAGEPAGQTDPAETFLRGRA